MPGAMPQGRLHPFQCCILCQGAVIRFVSYIIHHAREHSHFHSDSDYRVVADQSFPFQEGRRLQIPQAHNN